MTPRQFSITEQFKNLRVDRFLSAQSDMPSRSNLKKLFDQEKISINGVPAKPSAKLRPGDLVTAEIPLPRKSELEPEDIPITVIYEDADLVVVDKPAGMLTHPTPSTTTGTLVNALLHHCEDLSGIGGWIKPGIVHRLDKLTSGVIVAAKNDKAHQKLAAQFKDHSIDRRYAAVVWGEMRNISGTIETEIGRNRVHRLRMTTKVKKGRRAVTHYRVLSRNNGLSLVELRLETGRTHQIRVHLSENKHPVVGDGLYGKGRVPSDKLDPEKKSAVRQMKRQALHAFRLGFLHPSSGEWMAFESPPPPDMAALIAALDLAPDKPLPEKPERIE